jgi:hypothetical protein
MAKKKLTPADEKFIAKFLNADGKLDFDAKVITRINKYTGVEVEVDPISAVAIDFILKLEKAMYLQRGYAEINPNLKASNAVQNFDRARMLVLKLNPNAYMNLID